MMGKIFLPLLILVALLACQKKQEGPVKAPETKALKRDLPEAQNTTPAQKPLSILEFVALSKEHPTGFDLTCRPGTKEFRRVNEAKKVDARFCSAEGSVAVTPILRVQDKQHTLQTANYRATHTLESGALSWLHNDGLLVNFESKNNEWRVRLADAKVFTFEGQSTCPFDASIERKIEEVYGADICTSP